MLVLGAGAALYAGFGILGFSLETQIGRALPIYLAPGMGLVLLWKFGPGHWPAVFLGAGVVLALRGWELSPAAAGAAAITLVLAAICRGLRARDFRPDFSRLRDALSFLGLTAASSFAFGILVAWAFPGENGVLRLAAGSMMGPTLGIFIAAPPLLMWSVRDVRARYGLSVRPLEAVALFLALALACGLAFGGWLGSGDAHYHLAFLPYPILLWIGLRLGPLLLVTGTSLSCVAAAYGTLHDVGPFAGQSPTEQVIMDYLFIGTIQISCLMFAAVLSERSNAEDALRNEKERAESATRAKSEFLSVMSHELRTPLNSIVLATDLMLESDLSAELRDLGQTVMRAGEALRTLVNDTLDMARIEEGRMELSLSDFSPGDLSNGVIDLFADAAKRKGIQLKGYVDPRVSESLCADAVRLRQVLINLVGNALKFTGEGSVHLQTRCEEQGPESQVIRWTITDSGPGIPEEALADIFEPFTQVDSGSTRVHGGTGLGLAISQRLVRLMGGKIGVTSELGRGSTFWVTLPLPHTAAPQASDHTDAAAGMTHAQVA